MLRITRQTQGESRLLLILEGWIVSDSLSVLDEAVREARRQGTEIALDLSHVLYVDCRAVGFLKGLRGDGVRVVGTSEVVNKLVED